MTRLNKNFAIILCFVIALIGTLFTSTKVEAASYPSSLSNVKKEATLKYNGYDSLFYKTTGNYKVFCTTFHTKNVGSSCKLASNQWSNSVQAGLAAIIDKYNGSQSQKNYYYAELATNEFLYYYSGKNSVNRISTVRDVRNTSGVKAFYDVAVNAYNKANKSFDLTLTTSSGKLTFSESGNYYLSNKITVKDKNGNLSNYTPIVSGAKDAKIYKKSGNSFYIRVPKSSIKVGESKTIKLTVKGTKTTKGAKRFDCGSGNQYVTINMTIKNSLNSTKSMSGKITRKGNTIKVTKKDSATKKVLVGATLVVKDSKGNEKDKWVSTTSAHTIKNLEAGNYTLSEIEAPEGYKLSTELKKFTVKEDGKTVSIDMYNTKYDTTIIEVTKKDSDTKKNLAGATLVIKDSSGKELKSWVSTTGVEKISGLSLGKYTLSEKQAPEGYKLSNEVQNFEVKNDGKIVKLEMYNTKEEITTVNVEKIDSKTGDTLAGATLVVKDSNGQIVDSWVSTTDVHTVTGLAVGKYTLIETLAPNGYELNNEVQSFEVKNDGKTITLTVKNTPVEIVTKARISKQDSTTGKELPGATLVIKNSNGEEIKKWVSTTKPQEFELEPGTYTLTETIAPVGYQLKTETIEFEVQDDGTVTEVVMYNTPLKIPDEPVVPENPDAPVYKVIISKQDITTKSELPGATLVIKDSKGKEISRWVSGTTPKEFELEAGDYTLTEIQAPNGYDLSYEVINFTVKADNTVTTEVVMYNSKTPETADKNIILVVTGIIIAGLGSIFGFKKFKKQL